MNHDDHRYFDKNLKADLKEGFSKVKDSVKDLGTEKFNEVSDKADKLYHDAKEQSDEMMQDMKKTLCRIEKKVHAHVREKPNASLAIAAGIGFLLAMVLGR